MTEAVNSSNETGVAPPTIARHLSTCTACPTYPVGDLQRRVAALGTRYLSIRAT